MSLPPCTNRNLVANFALTPYAITTSSSPAAGGATSGGGTVNCGSSVTVAASPSAGYSFVNWTESGRRRRHVGQLHVHGRRGTGGLVANFTTIPCTYSLSPSSASFAAEGGSSSVTVTALPSTCPWTASTTYNWIHTTSSGTGSGTASYSVDANTSTSMRSGTLTIAGQSFTVSQAAASGGPDTTPPTVSMTSPIGGSTVSNTSTLTASATDNVSVTRVDFYSDVAFVGRATVSSGGLFTVPCDTTQMANGSHTFCAKAYDAAGNWTISGDTTVTVSNPVGVPQWVRHMVAGLTVSPAAISVDHLNNVVVAGSFQISADFGAGTIAGAGGYDAFIAKYTPQNSGLLSGQAHRRHRGSTGLLCGD